MLNCTDLECILHHHHYYAHLHHLKHGTHVDEAESAGEGYSDDPVQGILNDTDSDDVSDFSHLDAPNESLYMVGGLCVAMFLVGVIILLLAITISKLRKREEHSNTVHPTNDGTATTVVLQTSPNGTTNGTVNTITGANGTVVQNHQQQNQNGVKDGAAVDPLAYRGMFLWQFPPPPTPQSQYLYSTEQNAIVQKNAMERQGSFRGLRKNLGGQWRRLVKKKPPQQNYAIPAELKPQLKQIYVY